MFGKKAFFRVPQHQQFHYKPMHYNPQKEELEDRLKTIKELQKDDVDGVKARISSGMRSGHMADEAYRKQQLRRSAITLVSVIVMLVVLTYLLLSVYLPELTKLIE